MCLYNVTLPTERVSWNSAVVFVLFVFGVSRSPRSVWVEIPPFLLFLLFLSVTLPTERVSWNFFSIGGVFPPAESRSPRSVWVEIPFLFLWDGINTSRSPRSVWVEISALTFIFIQSVVTLPTERVSWNLLQSVLHQRQALSRSPRSVWVEMSSVSSTNAYTAVTLPTERVSWNTFSFSLGRY